MRSFANRFTDMVFRAREFFHLSEYVLGDSLRYDDDTVHVANDDVDGRDVDADDDRIRVPAEDLPAQHRVGGRPIACKKWEDVLQNVTGRSRVPPQGRRRGSRCL